MKPENQKEAECEDQEDDDLQYQDEPSCGESGFDSCFHMNWRRPTYE